MSTDYFTENTYEQALIELFEELGYNYQYGPDLQRDYRNPLLEEQLLESLRRLNPTLPVSALEDVVKALRQIEGSSLYECNFKFTQMMQYRVKYVQDRDAEAKEKMVKYTILSGVGILSLLTIGIVGLMESHKNDNRVYTW